MKFRALNIVIVLIIASILLLYPAVGNRYFVFVMTLGLVNIIVTIGVNLIIGYSGQVSLGQAAFLAVGTYSTVVFSGMLGYPFPLVMLISGALAGILGLIVAIPALRLRHLYLAVSTLAFHTIIMYFVRNSASLGGSGGILVGRPILWANYMISSYSGVCYITLATTIVIYMFVRNLIKSKEGRALMAVRGQEIVASALGIEVFKYKLKAFLVSSFITGLAGSLFGYTLEYIDPEHFTIETAIIYIGMGVVGGMGSQVGPILGGAFFTILPEIIRLIRPSVLVLVPQIAGRFEDIFVIANGVIIVYFLIFMPNGLAGLRIFVRKEKAKEVMEKVV